MGYAGMLEPGYLMQYFANLLYNSTAGFCLMKFVSTGAITWQNGAENRSTRRVSSNARARWPKSVNDTVDSATMSFNT